MDGVTFSCDRGRRYCDNCDLAERTKEGILGSLCDYSRLGVQVLELLKLTMLVFRQFPFNKSDMSF